VWLDLACTDPALSVREELTHLPCHLARCPRLLLLAGQGINSRLWPVIELYSWVAMGGTVAGVAFAATAKEADAIVGGFDAFYVRYPFAGGGVETRLLSRAVELATAATIDEAVRSYSTCPVTARSARRGG